MKTLDIYILKNFIKYFLLGILAFINVFILGDAFRILGSVVNKSLTPFHGFEVLMYGLPAVIIDTVPLAILIGGLMAINKMASSLEIIALKTSGISFFRIVQGPIIFSFMLSLFMFWFNDQIVPVANKRRRLIRENRSAMEEMEAKLKADIYFSSKNILYYIRFLNGGSKSLNNIEIIKMNKDFTKILEIIIATSGKYNIKTKKWTLSDVWQYTPVYFPGGQKTKGKYMETLTPEIMKNSPEDFLKEQFNINELSIKKLQNMISFMKRAGGDIKELLQKLYKKVFYPFASFVLVFIGLALGSRYVRGGSAISIGLSVVIGYMYYVANSTTEALILGDLINPVLGSMLPNLIFFAVGIFAMLRAEY